MAPRYYEPAPRPPGYGGSGGGSIADIILRGGDAQARAHLERGAIWADTMQGLGQTIGTAIQQHGEQKEIAKRDQAWLDFVDSGAWQDPKQAAMGVLKIWGPGEEGRAQLQALGGVMQLGQPKRNPEADQKAATAIGAGMVHMTEEGRARAYPAAYSLLQRTMPELAQQLPPTYDAKVWQETLAPLFAGGGGAPKTRQIEVRNPDGSTSVQIVEDRPGQVFNSAPDPGAGKLVTTVGPDGKPVQRMATPQELAAGVPVYQEPKSGGPGLEKIETVDEQGRPVTRFVRPSEGASFAKPSGSAKPATGAQRKALAFFNRGREADEIVTSLESGEELSPYVLRYAPDWANFALSNPNQAYRQAQRTFTEARLRKESGAAIKDDEYESDAKKYFAQPGDSPETIRQKQAMRAAVLSGIAFESGDALQEFYGDEAAELRERYKTGQQSARPGAAQPGAQRPAAAPAANAAPPRPPGVPANAKWDPARRRWVL